MTKTVAYTCLHYGIEYLPWAIRSVIDYVDEYIVLYSPVGSHGKHAPMPCPETRAQLYVAALKAAGKKLRWYDGTWPYEAAQRGTVLKVAPDADIILVLDADEIWPHELAVEATRACSDFTSYRVPMVHFWRSFSRCVTNDYSYPVRILAPRAKLHEETQLPRAWGEIAHMGYAQTPGIVQYKQYTHGHFAEWRKDWYETKFLANAQRDVHPCNIDFWTPVAVDPAKYLPEWMKEHPNWGKVVIE